MEITLALMQANKDLGHVLEDVWEEKCQELFSFIFQPNPAHFSHISSIL